MGNVFTFGTRCLQAKQFIAFKNQNGVPGFIAPYTTRYLSVQINVDITWVNNADSYFHDQHNQYNIAFDRITNQASGDPTGYLAEYIFPYYQPLDDSWSVSDAKYVHAYTETIDAPTPSLGGIYKTTTITVTLSNEYTLGQLDADASDIIKSLMASTVNFGQVVVGYADEHFYDPLFNPGALIGNHLPPNASFDFELGTAPNPLKAVAWNVWEPQIVSSIEWFGNNYSKLVSIVKMAGNYCLKTYQIDGATEAQISQTCASGTGTCTNAFEVDPPAPVSGQNSYTLLIGNCQCGQGGN